MVCRALLTEPEVLLLDEPTAGMDALSRRQMWSLLKKLNEKKLTIMLTTHYMEEAQSLCERVAMLDKGKLTRVSTPQNMIEELGMYAVDVMTEEGMQSHFFAQKEDAVAFVAKASEETVMRSTTLEDVFVEQAKHG